MALLAEYRIHPLSSSRQTQTKSSMPEEHFKCKFSEGRDTA